MDFPCDPWGLPWEVMKGLPEGSERVVFAKEASSDKPRAIEIKYPQELRVKAMKVIGDEKMDVAKRCAFDFGVTDTRAVVQREEEIFGGLRQSELVVVQQVRRLGWSVWLGPGAAAAGCLHCQKLCPRR